MGDEGRKVLEDDGGDDLGCQLAAPGGVPAAGAPGLVGRVVSLEWNECDPADLLEEQWYRVLGLADGLLALEELGDTGTPTGHHLWVPLAAVQVIREMP
jgi:hypothetical protein